MPEWFEIGIPQSFAWTLLAPYIKSCPADTPRLPWQNFPALIVTNNPNASDPNTYPPAITHNRTQLSYPGREVNFIFEDPGKHVGPNNSYVTNTTAGAPAFAAWISQLNVTYTPLYNVVDPGNGTHSASAVQPEGYLYFKLNPLVNGTVFVVLTDTDLYVTPHNVSLMLPHVVAGPEVYMAG